MQLFFLIEPGPYFILIPETLSLGEHEHFIRKSFFWGGDIFYETLKMECICYTSPRGELFFFQLNIDADCYFTAMLPRVFCIILISIIIKL